MTKLFRRRKVESRNEDHPRYAEYRRALDVEFSTNIPDFRLWLLTEEIAASPIAFSSTWLDEQAFSSPPRSNTEDE